ncbi:hypothetical protein CVT26_006886 [Gymnopilus dilepis]|uniref:Cyanovirin-N domain-containing protein n=1 Tax=Gymnopilus dilepis TaxID=231916 RepID=A0A409W0Y6_9AGAR|nr:hypothetical protein CVT26_006886 [Gymnopilus dilepis]
MARRHTKFTSATLVALACLSVGIQADIVAFSGQGCTGAAGLNVACDNDCILYRGRESFEITASGIHCISFYSGTVCADPVVDFVVQGPGICLDTVQFGDLTFFACSPNVTCLN